MKRINVQWTPIKDFPNYLVSSMGDVENRNTQKQRKPQLTHKGYHKIFLYNKEHKTQRFVHRLVAEAFIPNPENKPCVNHIDGNKTNNNVENLEWCTVQENNGHAKRLKLYKPLMGQDHANSKVTDSDVLEIRRLHSEGNTCKSIAPNFGLHKTTVQRIVNKETWRHM